MSNSVPILPINQITYATDRGITASGDIISHLEVLPKEWSSDEAFWVLETSKNADAQSKVKALLAGNKLPRNNIGILDRIPGQLHMIQRGDETGAHAIFFRESLAQEVPMENIRIFKIAAGPLEMSIGFDTNTNSFGTTLQIYLQAPIVGAISVASVSGCITDDKGLTVQVAYPQMMKGGVDFKQVNNKNKRQAVLSWDVTVFKKQYKSNVIVFQIDNA